MRASASCLCRMGSIYTCTLNMMGSFSSSLLSCQRYRGRAMFCL
jgi:hypothetical protein